MTPEGLLFMAVIAVLCIIIGTCKSKLPIAAKTAIVAVALGGFAWLLGAATSDRLDVGIMSAFFTMLIVACTGVIVARIDEIHKKHK